jgi:hypothetical protein
MISNGKIRNVSMFGSREATLTICSTNATSVLLAATHAPTIPLVWQNITGLLGQYFLINFRSVLLK